MTPGVGSTGGTVAVGVGFGLAGGVLVGLGEGVGRGRWVTVNRVRPEPLQLLVRLIGYVPGLASGMTIVAPPVAASTVASVSFPAH